MAKRKPTEFAINMFCGNLAMLQQDRLDAQEVKDIFAGNPPHIYFILKRARIYFDPSTFIPEDEHISIDYKVQNKNGAETFKSKFRNYLGTRNLALKCEYPYTYFEIVHKDSGEFLVGGDVAIFLTSNFYHLQKPEILNCEVLYIGQSFGTAGSRTALDRLKSHSTLQLIYSEAIKKNPDSEIWIALASFDQYNIMVFDGHNKYSTEELEQDKGTFTGIYNKLNHEGINEQQKINFTEAALIKYFQPLYNKEYKDTFPNPAHSSYSECYELDINSVCFELDTSDKVFCRFFSPTIEPKPLHMHTFLLHSPEERKALFEIF